MASITTFEIQDKSFAVNNAFQKPPIPSRPSTGKFHNRGSGKLFPSTQQNKLFTEVNTETRTDAGVNDLALVLHPDSKIIHDISEPSTPKSVPNYLRRTQSAKARSRERGNTSVRTQTKQPRPASAGSGLSRNKIVENGICSTKPAVINLASKVIPDLFQIEKEKLLALPDSRGHSNNVFHDTPPMHFSRPSSGKLSDLESGIEFSSHSKKENNKVQNNLKPTVYGLQRQRQFYGSAPDLSSTNFHYDQFPYKITPKVENLAIEYQPEKSDIPTTLEPLLPWLQEDVPAEVLGVSSDSCLVFLTPSNWLDLPEVPEPQSVEEDLAYIQDVSTPKPWNPKKYPYYNSKQPVEDWVCNHGSQLTALDHEQVNGHTVYRHTFTIPRMRTADIIRKEISDLENLLKVSKQHESCEKIKGKKTRRQEWRGERKENKISHAQKRSSCVGSKDSDCSMVQYQSEISAFQTLLNDTLAMVPERLKNPAPESPKDRFGLNKICADHDIIIRNIIERVRECREELAELEKEAGIETARQHFRQRSNSVL